MAEPFLSRLRVRFNECDAQGIVFSANYLAYADVVLTEMWRALFGGYARMTDTGVDVVVAESRLRFLSSAHFDDELEVSVEVAHLGTTSMTLIEAFRRVGEPAALAEVEMRYVWVTLADHAKTPIPDWARGTLAAYG